MLQPLFKTIRGEVAILKDHSRPMIIFMWGQGPQASPPFLVWSHLGVGFPSPTDWRGKETASWTHPHPPHGSVWPAAGLACCWGDSLKARIFSAGSRGQMSRFWGQAWLRPSPGKLAWVRLWEKAGVGLAQMPVCGKHLLISFVAHFPETLVLVFLPPFSRLSAFLLPSAPEQSNGSCKNYWEKIRILEFRWPA